MGHADHQVWAPSKRWAILVAYWAVSFSLAYQKGLVTYLLEQDVKTPDHWMYLVGFIGHIPLMLAAWDFSAYAFNREVKPFVAIVYPLGHNCDTLRWYYSFDLGRTIIKTVCKLLLKWDHVGMLLQFIAGWGCFAMFMMTHRKTFELWYLPEHHPPKEIDGKYIRGNSLYIITGIFISIPMMWIFHFRGDMIWGMVLQYGYNLYVALRVRIPQPWDDGNHVDESKVEPWKKYLVPGTY